MSITLFLVITVVVLALAFDYTNGFHDAANAIATSVSTRALTPRVALGMAAVMNVIGAMLGTEVAKTIGDGIIDIKQFTDSGDANLQLHGLVIVLGALVGAIVWNLITWWFGLPSSSSHALIGGLVGAGLASATQVEWYGILHKVIIPMFASPVVGFVLAYGFMVLILWIFKSRPYHRTMRRFRILQTISAAAMALGHGLQDAQKTMGVIVMALIAGGHAESWGLIDAQGGLVIPWEVKIASALAISLGTYSGGWRIMRTLGRKMIELDPARGFAAETVAAGVLYTTAFVTHSPISTTHTITAAIMGAGATKSMKAVRWNVARDIVIGWFLTIPAAAAVAAVIYWIFNLII
ncbi:anion permease [Boudabousia liubingyangii]|uniref:Anion permease n=1 Tax=Boudabousia liubingyangii TaxID=1921764 RepID=A0A1Q5PPU4_9ACTO|nr:inorganic phosphate transporter [Boudabousia liubingyangii]OKL48410.1 anion permease [Boudabousia liubingyangii]OKL49564.1 anion permease [Boudabousia liubingyangii]